MKAEIITIGDEILIGQIVDTNSAWMGSKLNEIGWEVSRIHTISDDVDAIVDTIKEASIRSAAVLVTGGLGPTKDDVTKIALCKLFDCALAFDQATYDYITAIFKTVQKPMLEAHRSQAMLPEACKPLINQYGTAPGMMFELNGCKIISMPGVPYEMRGLMQSSVLPVLLKLSREHIAHTTLVTANVPESIIAQSLEKMEAALPSYIKLAYLPHYNFVRLRLTGRGQNAKALQTALLKHSNQIKGILKDVVIAEEDLSIAQIIGKLLTQKEQTVSFAESCTGGYVAHMMTAVSGSSAYFPGSVVTYSYDNKTEVLGVDAETLWSDGAVSESVVKKMCASVLAINRTDYALALSGIAGPGGGTNVKPVGTLWIAVCDKNEVYAKLYHLKGNRIQNIERSAHLGLEMLRKLIVGKLAES